MPIAVRNACLMLLLAVVSSSAMADWVKIGTSETDILYVDPSTIRGTDNTAKMWALNDFKAAQRRDNGEQVKSEKAEYEYDCKAEQSRLLYFTSHTGNMAAGEIVNYNFVPSEWMRISAGSGLETLWKIACGKV